jgi:ATP-dependent DNA ligase
LYKTPAPKELDKTILRAELYVPGKKGSATAQILNSNVWKARETGKLETRIFDVVTYNGKNMENAPYSEKLKVLQKVHQKFPQLKLPQLAYTETEKNQLLQTIKNKTYPDTKEGLIVYDLNASVPQKVKLSDDYDVLITGTFPSDPNSKYNNSAIGGFLGQIEGKGPTLRIGTGLNDRLRKDAYTNPDAYVNS